MRKCANGGIWLHHQVHYVKKVLENIWCNKIQSAKQKRGDSACPCQTSLTGFTARTGQAGSQLACLRWPVLVPGPEQAGFPAVSKLKLIFKLILDLFST
jgi:hypothetical protein